MVTIQTPYPEIIDTINLLQKEVRFLDNKLKEKEELINSILEKNSNDVYLTTKEASAYAKRCKKTILTAINTGRLIASGKGVSGSNFRIKKTDLENFIQNRNSKKAIINVEKKENHKENHKENYKKNQEIIISRIAVSKDELAKLGLIVNKKFGTKEIKLNGKISILHEGKEIILGKTYNQAIKTLQTIDCTNK